MKKIKFILYAVAGQIANTLHKAVADFPRNEFENNKQNKIVYT